MAALPSPPLPPPAKVCAFCELLIQYRRPLPYEAAYSVPAESPHRQYTSPRLPPWKNEMRPAESTRRTESELVSTRNRLPAESPQSPVSVDRPAEVASPSLPLMDWYRNAKFPALVLAR